MMVPVSISVLIFLSQKHFGCIFMVYFNAAKIRRCIVSDCTPVSKGVTTIDKQLLNFCRRIVHYYARSAFLQKSFTSINNYIIFIKTKKFGA